MGCLLELAYLRAAELVQEAKDVETLDERVNRHGRSLQDGGRMVERSRIAREAYSEAPR